MNDKNDPPRSLEKICHYFLTGETPADQGPGAPVGNAIINEATLVPSCSIHQLASEYDRIESTVAQLYVLRDSCKGMYYTQYPDNDIIWFKGAAAILQDAITNLIRTLRFIDDNNNKLLP